MPMYKVVGNVPVKIEIQVVATNEQEAVDHAVRVVSGGIDADDANVTTSMRLEDTTWVLVKQVENTDG